MTLLSVVKEVARAVGVPDVISVFSNISGNRTMQEMLALANEMAQRIAYDEREWTELKLSAVLAGDGATTAFDLPQNYKRMLLTANVWRSTTTNVPMLFIPDTDEWMNRRAAGIHTGHGEWTLMAGQIHIFPAMILGETASFVYLDKNCITLASGGVNDTFVTDGDTFRLDERLLKLGMIWQWKAQKGSPYAEDMGTYGDAITHAMGADKPGPIIVGRKPLSSASTGVAPSSFNIALQGPQGPPGPQGVPGPQGPQGNNGAAGLVGPPGAAGPQGPAGSNGTNGAPGVPGSIGPQGPQGVPGTTGAAGSAMLSGVGVPDVGLGVPGDWYIDINAAREYGPKTTGTPITAFLLSDAAPTNNNDTPYRSGNTYKSLQAGRVVGARFWRSMPQTTASRQVMIFDSTDTLVATSNASTEPANLEGWVEVTFPTPWVYAANTTFSIIYDDPNTPYTPGAPTLIYPTAMSFVVAVWGTYNAGSSFPTTGSGAFSFFADPQVELTAIWPIAIQSLIGPTGATGVAGAAGAAGATGPQGPPGPVPEAPTDGQSYARRGSDASWQVAGSGGGGGGIVTSPFTIPAQGANVSVNVASSHGLLPNMEVIVGDGVNFMNAHIVSVPSGPFSGFNTMTIPAYVGTGDAREFGFWFYVTTTGAQALAVKYYRYASLAGGNVASLWNASGTLLSTVTFSGETLSGWQTQNFTAPVALTQNALYCISYHGNGTYLTNVITADIVNGPLVIPSDPNAHTLGVSGNGVYNTAGYGFPSANISQFWPLCDIVVAVTGSASVVLQNNGQGGAVSGTMAAGTLNPSGHPIGGGTGPAGPTGPAGATGATGPAGPTGAAGATGATGPAGPSAVSANAGNTATLGTDNLIFVPAGTGGTPSSAPPLMDGTAAAGSATAYSRGDHVHPTDTSLLPLAGGTLTGPVISTSRISVTAAAEPAGLAAGTVLASANVVSGKAYFHNCYLSGGADKALTAGYTAIADFDQAGGTWVLKVGTSVGANATSTMTNYISVNAAGTTIANKLTLNADPTTALGAATKQYVDAGDTALTNNKVAKSGDTMTGALTAPLMTISSADGILTLNKSGSGQYAYIQGKTANSTRWQMMLGDNTAESGGNAGSNFVLNSLNDAGSAYIGTAFQINRATSNTTLGADLQILGSNGIKASGTTWANPSDARIKQDVQDYRTGLDDVIKLRPVSFKYRPQTNYPEELLNQRQVGFIAQEVEDVMPDMVTAAPGQVGDIKLDDLRTLDTNNLVFALCNAIRELADRVQQLEAKS
jgi:hypothetical protein